MPPFSPDLNLIEETFSEVKALLRCSAARAREALVEAMDAALNAITAQDVRSFFAYCGYLIPGQLQRHTL